MNQANRPSLLQLLSFAAPGLAIAWLIPPMPAIMGDFYLRHTEATAAGIGTAMVLSKVFDGLTDLPIGYLSDHTKSRWGSRKPWIAAGAILSLYMLWFFFMPPATAGSLYFGIGVILFYLVFTLIKIPVRSWLGELTADYNERGRLWSGFTIASLLGGVVIMVLPVILSLPSIGLFKSAEFDLDMMRFIGWLGILVFPLTIGLALWKVPQGRRNPGEPPHIRDFFSIIIRNRPYRTFLLGHGLSAVGFGVFYSTIIIAITSYFKFADKVPLFLLAVIFAQVASIPLWGRLAQRVDKHKVWAMAWMGHAICGPLLLLYAPTGDNFISFTLYGCLMSILQAPHMLFPVVIVNDIVDYDTMKFKGSRSGNYFALFTLTDKVMGAIGFGVGYYIIALSGYDAKLAEHSATQVAGLMTAVAIVPSLCFAASSLILMRFGIDRRRHGIIRRRIDRAALRDMHAKS